MNQARIDTLIDKQRHAFRTGETLPLVVRLRILRRLKEGLLQRESAFLDAIQADLGKSHLESLISELAVLEGELRYYLHHLNRLTKTRLVPLSKSQLPATAEIVPSPKGCVLVMTPWRAPLFFALLPAISALAAGNTVLLYSHPDSPRTAQVLHRFLSDCIPSKFLALVHGKEDVRAYLLRQKFDHICYTGNAHTARFVMRQAAEQLTPLTLVLAGKNPCIVDETANLPLTARRIVFGKCLHAGQHYLAPDFLWVQERVRAELLQHIRREIRVQYGVHPLKSPDYGRMANQSRFDKALALLEKSHILHGGAYKAETLQIAPTLVAVESFAAPFMQEEIAAPILPVLSFSDIQAVKAQLLEHPTPLALYLFSEHAQTQHEILKQVHFGGACLNDTMLHSTSPYLPFGGVGESGMGAYHGKAGFDNFTHYKSILEQPTHVDIPLRYAPYDATKSKIVRGILRGL